MTRFLFPSSTARIPRFLSGNELTGTIPQSIGQLTKVEELCVAGVRRRSFAALVPCKTVPLPHHRPSCDFDLQIFERKPAQRHHSSEHRGAFERAATVRCRRPSPCYLLVLCHHFARTRAARSWAKFSPRPARVCVVSDAAVLDLSCRALSGNQLVGTIPESIGQLANLKELCVPCDTRACRPPPRSPGVMGVTGGQLSPLWAPAGPSSAARANWMTARRPPGSIQRIQRPCHHHPRAADLATQCRKQKNLWSRLTLSATDRDTCFLFQVSRSQSSSIRHHPRCDLGAYEDYYSVRAQFCYRRCCASDYNCCVYSRMFQTRPPLECACSGVVMVVGVHVENLIDS